MRNHSDFVSEFVARADLQRLGRDCRSRRGSKLGVVLAVMVPLTVPAASGPEGYRADRIQKLDPATLHLDPLIEGALLRKRVQVGDLVISVFRVLPGRSAATQPLPHRHDAAEISVVIEGAATIRSKDESIDLRPGQMVLIPPNAVHGGSFSDDGLLLLTITQAGAKTEPASEDELVSAESR